MAQGTGLPKMTQSGGGYPPAHVNAALASMNSPGRGVPNTARDYKGTTPGYVFTPLTHQNVTVRSGR